MAKDDNDDDDYDVGYGKPPKATQFKAGQSGNPKGRPGGTRNLKTDLLEELNQKVQVTVGGRILSVSKQRAMLMRASEKALKGDMRAIELLAKLAFQHLDDTGSGDKEQPLSINEAQILADYIEQQKQLPQEEEPDT